MNEEYENIIELTDEDGKKVEFELLLTYEYGDNFYVSLLPVEPLEGMEDGEVMLMRIEEDGDEEVYTPIETEEELEGAWNAFMDIYYEGEDISDEEDEEDEE